MNQKQGLKKHIIINGIVLGVTLSVIEFLAVALGLVTSSILGYVFLIVIMLSLMLAVKKYRDGFQQGLISFGDAFVVSFFICLISGAIWAIYRFIQYSVFPYVLTQLVDPIITNMNTLKSPETEANFAILQQIISRPFFWAFATFFFYMTLGGSLLSLYIAFILKRDKIYKHQG
jgi:hypothetical protein